MKTFVKRGDAAVLRAEAEGLLMLAMTNTIRVPRVFELHEDRLVLEWLDFAQPDAGFGERFGRALAALHAIPFDEPFGWLADNFIGATPQVNTRSEDWPTFWRESRLHPMLARLRDPELAKAVGAAIDAIPSLFQDGYEPRASLIHGDLWSGNWGMLADGTPVIYDPCVSYSDAEADVAMMELFGSPPTGFRQGYGSPQAGYARRKHLYQLYHLLNHAVLFGGGYRQQSLRCAEALADLQRRG
ncbi:fructosamine kinase family protein [Ramlibacter sp. PS4R-6]|uniref:fructosamine kinase family protein n=1 Tax=Ramlibacter sp. PS4R-6 TaxID=3133438 RepID=UPI003099EA46